MFIGGGFPTNPIIGDFRYGSTIDAIDDLYAKYAYLPNINNLPILILMHGFHQHISDFTNNDVFNRLARYGVFVCAVSMRGSDDSSGSHDSSGRELYDILDAINYVKTNFPNVVDANRVAIVGYSGGGANALGCAIRFPDTFTDVIAHFPISDYGYSNPDGWWYHAVSSRPLIENSIGGTPATVPNKYHSRAFNLGITNYTGKLHLYHDNDDSIVPLINTQKVVQTLDLAGMTNYSVSYTSSVNVNRWLHALPNAVASVRWTEDYWCPVVTKKVNPVWTIPVSGSIKAMGYLETKHFNIWLGDGTEHVADVVYNTSTDSYTVTPLTGEMTVTIAQGAKTATQTINSEATIIVT